MKLDLLIDATSDDDWQPKLLSARQKLTTLLQRFPFTSAQLRGHVQTHFSLKPSGYRRRLKIFAPNPQSEYVIGRALLRNPIINTKSTREIKNFEATPFVYKIINAFLNHLEYLSAKRIDGTNKIKNVGTDKSVMGKNKVVKSTNRPIIINKPTYKKIFGSMIIQAREDKKLLLGFWNTEYTTVDNCFESFVKSNYLKRFNVDQHHKTGLTYPDIFKYAKDIGFNQYFYDIMGNLIDCQELDKPRKKASHAIISDNHYYSIQPFPKKQPKLTVVKIDKCDQIFDYVELTKGSIPEEKQYKYLVVNDEQEFKKFIKQAKQKYVLANYTPTKICIGTSVLEYNPFFDKMHEIKQNKKSHFNAMESNFNLRGIMSFSDREYFSDCQKINMYHGKYYNKEASFNISFDQYQSYVSQLRKQTLKIGIPSICDSWKPYNNTHKLHGWYYIEFNEYDRILYPRDGIYNGYELQLIKKSHIKKILYQYITKKVIDFKLSDDDYNKYGKQFLTMYIGWLNKSYSFTTKKAQLNTFDEQLALKDKYKMYDTFVNDDNTTFSFSKSFLQIKTGVLARLSIMASCNIQLYQFNKDFIKLNPSAKLNQIKTDMLGYIIDLKNLKLPTKWLKEESGYFRIEKQFDHTFEIHKDYCYGNDYSDEKPNYIVSKKQTIKGTSDNILQLVKQRKSFQINGPPGFGKTYNLEKTIIPELNKNNSKYIITGSTTKASKNLKSNTIQFEISSKMSIEDLDDKFKDIDYIIIDESSQLVQRTFYVLEYLKKEHNVQIILIGDSDQCKATDNDIYEAWIKSKCVLNLCDNIIVEMPYIETICRYDQELKNIITELKKYKDNTSKAIELIKSKFASMSTLDLEVDLEDYKHIKTHIVRFHKTGFGITGINKKNTKKEIFNKDNQTYYTVESIQGSTLEDNFMIHDVDFMDWEHIYTAISRARKVEQIIIIY